MNPNRNTNYKKIKTIKRSSENSSKSTILIGRSSDGSATSQNKISWINKYRKCVGILFIALILMCLGIGVPTIICMISVNVTNFEESPWLARFVVSNGTYEIYGCTGIIISNDVILTAAHCFLNNVTEIHIGGTSDNNYSDIKRIPASKFNFFFHPDYDEESYISHDDIAKIVLKNQIVFSETFYPIILPSNGTKLPEIFGMNVWTKNQILDFRKTERKMNLESIEKCHEIYMTEGDETDLVFYKNDTKDPIIFCTGFEGYIPIGNSGTAAIVRNGNTAIAYGLLSMGGSKKTRLPNVFVNIQVYLEWIFTNSSIS